MRCLMRQIQASSVASRSQPLARPQWPIDDKFGWHVLWLHWSMEWSHPHPQVFRQIERLHNGSYQNHRLIIVAGGSTIAHAWEIMMLVKSSIDNKPKPQKLCKLVLNSSRVSTYCLGPVSGETQSAVVWVLPDSDQEKREKERKRGRKMHIFVQFRSQQASTSFWDWEKKQQSSEYIIPTDRRRLVCCPNINSGSHLIRQKRCHSLIKWETNMSL